MPRYTCVKCNAQCTSKNPQSRSVFLDDGTAAIITNLMNIETLVKPNGNRKVVLTFPYLVGNDDTNVSNETLELDAFKIIKEWPIESIKTAVCEHTWDRIPGTGKPV